MPLAEEIVAKTKEIHAFDALAATNATGRQRLETELAQIQKELAKQQGFLTLCQTQLKATLAEIPKLEKIIKEKATKPPDKAKAEASLKAAQVKLKGLKEQEPKLKKVVQELEAEVKTKTTARTHSATEAKSLATRKAELVAEMAALQVRLKKAQAIDAYTYDTILGNAAMLKDFGERTHNDDICAFIINGPKGNKATYDRFIKNDDINLEGAKDVRAAFQKLAATEKSGTAVDWTKAPWAAAHAYAIRDLKADARHLESYKVMLKKEKGVF